MVPSSSSSSINNGIIYVGFFTSSKIDIIKGQLDSQCLLL